MIEKTQGIVLDVTPVSESSRVVSWLTRDFGRISTMVKGSQRPKSQFLGQYDLFYTCELLFYPRWRTGLHIARECTPLQRRDPLRQDWAACALASHATDIAALISPADAPHPHLFRLLNDLLNHAAIHGADVRLIYWYDLQVLEAQGLSPRLRHCVACQQPVSARGSRLVFSHARGGVICRRCTATEGAPVTPESPDTIAVLRAWQEAPSPGAALKLRSTAQQLAAVDRLLSRFVSYHLDMSVPSRRLATDIIKEYQRMLGAARAA